MNIFINRVAKTTAWGGGSKTVHALTERLKGLGHNVVNHLNPAVFNDENEFKKLNLDVIFCFDPRPNHQGLRYEELYYMKKIFNAKIIQRIGDIGTHSKPELFALQQKTSVYSDFLIFPSSWAQKKLQSPNTNYSIIRNKPKDIFYSNRNSNTNIDNNIKLVTHHWSNNPKKGFDFYKELDKFIEDKNISFTYIGRVPKDYTLKNSKILEPIGDQELSEIIPQHHIYVTASIEEAGANHVLEAMACGLPVLYHNLGGSIPEYVENRGKAFNDIHSFATCLDSVIKDYKKYKKQVLDYNDVISNTVEQYLDIICKT